MKYKVGGAVHASTYIGEFDAASPDEAIEQAYNAAHISVCHECAHAISDPEVANLWAEDEIGDVTNEPSEHDKLCAAYVRIAALEAELAAALDKLMEVDPI